MKNAPTPDEAAERLRTTALRDFAPPRGWEDRDRELLSYKFSLMPDSAPVPVLMQYALGLIGLKGGGPGEKVAWWVDFTYKGIDCELAHQKFGVRLYLHADLSEDEAEALHLEIVKKLAAAVRVAESVLTSSAPEILNAGYATVVNQHRRLRHAYNYFRERALNPTHIDDKKESWESGSGTAWTFTSGRNVMNMHAFHDLVAAMTAYLSALEHDLVLALTFCDFDPASDALTDVIGSRWGEKWARIVRRDDTEAARLRERLTNAIERWRNPYSHGGFEKGHAATIYLHTPGIGALPIGLTSIRNSPLFSFVPATETDIEGVFALFDEIDAWFAAAVPYAMQWIESGLDVRFDPQFRAHVGQAATSAESFERLIDGYEHRQSIIDNMDF